MIRKRLLIIHGIHSKREAYEDFMREMEEGGYECFYFEYTVSEIIPEIVERLREFVLRKLPANDEAFDVFTFSFGAIIFRNYVGRYGIQNVGRVLMAVPPNRGSELLRLLYTHNGWNHFLGSLGRDFLHNEDKYLLPLPVGLEVGVIAGTKITPKRVYTKLPHHVIEELFDVSFSDGKVKIEETKVQGMRDFTTVHEYHDEIMDSGEFREVANRFLRTGSLR